MSAAADPAAAQSRNAEVPNSESKPSIKPNSVRDAKYFPRKYEPVDPPIPARENFRAAARKIQRLMLDFELAFLSNALKGLARIFDPVLVVVAVRRQQLDDFVKSAGARSAYRT